MMRSRADDLLTILVPRHPQRGQEIADLAAGGGMRSRLRSAGKQPDELTTVYIADTLGELGLFFALAQVGVVVMVQDQQVPQAQEAVAPATVAMVVQDIPGSTA